MKTAACLIATALLGLLVACTSGRNLRYELIWIRWHPDDHLLRYAGLAHVLGEEDRRIIESMITNGVVEVQTRTSPGNGEKSHRAVLLLFTNVPSAIKLGLAADSTVYYFQTQLKSFRCAPGSFDTNSFVTIQPRSDYGGEYTFYSVPVGGGNTGGAVIRWQSGSRELHGSGKAEHNP